MIEYGERRKTEEKKGVVQIKKKYRNTGTKEIKASSTKRARKKTLVFQLLHMIDNSSLTTIQRGRLREKAFAGRLIFLVGQLHAIALQCSNICLVYFHSSIVN